jgi:hypothetical protein
MQCAVRFQAVAMLGSASLLPLAWGQWGCGSSPTHAAESVGAANDADAEADADAVDGVVVAYDPPPLWSGGAPILIASGEQAISLGIDGTNVYWQNPGGSVFDCPLAGCRGARPTQISSLIGPSTGALETLAATSAGALFLTSYGAAMTAAGAADPGRTSTIFQAASGDTLTSLVSDAGHVYFIDDVSVDSGGTAPTLYACPTSGSCASPKRLYALSANDEGSLGPLAVSGSEVYVVENDSSSSIRAVPIDGGPARTVCSSELLPEAQALTVAGGYAYFTTASDLTSIYQCATAGGSKPTLFVQDLQPYGLASDGKNLYWTNYVSGKGSVATCALGATCSSAFTVALGQEYPFAIAANGASVYWATADEVFRADR